MDDYAHGLPCLTMILHGCQLSIWTMVNHGLEKNIKYEIFYYLKCPHEIYGHAQI